jgi:nitrite reductase/ring-hydroxylating ferredoxin subunit
LKEAHVPEYSVGSFAKFAEGDRRVVKCGETEIGVFRVDGQFYAWHNVCAHLGGPVCQGGIMRKVVEPVDAEGRVRTLDYHATERHLVCPWHGYEFSLKTGRHPGHPHLRLKQAAVKLRDGEIYVVL